jgi:hypothetical protein
MMTYIPPHWPRPDPGGGWKLGGAWWQELPAVWKDRFLANGLPIEWYAARTFVATSNVPADKTA